MILIILDKGCIPAHSRVREQAARREIEAAQ